MILTGAETFLETLATSGLPPLRGARRLGDDFRAGVVTRTLGPLRLAEIRTPGGECFRDARSGLAAHAEMWQLDVMLRGRVRAEQGGGTAELGPADLILIDPVRPVWFASTDATRVSMLVPRQALRLRAADADRLAGVRIRGDSGPAALVSSLVREMARPLTGFRAVEEVRSAAAVVELISVALAAQLGDAGAVPDDEALRDRIAGFVEARLADRDLTPASIAAAHHMSVRRLHKLFEGAPLTVAALIRRRRLERCHADLAGTGRTVASVAARWGFADPAHFSRLFKAAYGYNAAALTSSGRARTVKALASGPGQDGAHGTRVNRGDACDPRPDVRGLERG
ncbi:helix-turn-helix domain-containing protein [Catenuloplanes sp. NPDC051500]|uniref:helix-turn-helix domain-containing protein n=1 Tax=Catenuloplanes sp. NPDC051500 TaxID=3363959 RepID=UPI0037987460